MRRHNLDLSDTIFALISGALPSAVAVIRLSGGKAFSIASQLFRPKGLESLPRKRGMYLGTLFDSDGRKIDEVVTLCFRGPHSFTGEDVVEFQGHGSRPVVHRLEQELLKLGARPAHAGEFSYRAFLNDKISASDVENLGDVFQARQGADLERIYRRRDGSLEKVVEQLRGDLIRVQAILDTAVDFSEEYSAVVASAVDPLRTVIDGCSVITGRYSAFREGPAVPRIVLAGQPNAGKSSLFNAMLCRYRAIVHSEPGTTRDVIEEDIEIDGQRFKLVDTAGFRLAAAESEEQGIELGTEYLSACSVWILVVDGCQGTVQSREFDLLEKYGATPHLIAWNKSDAAGWRLPDLGPFSQRPIPVSALSGAGLVGLWDALDRNLRATGDLNSGPLPTAVQTERLKQVGRLLGELLDSLSQFEPPEYLAEKNRCILGLLEGVIGEVDPELILDRIFGEFCIGK